jgi:hypothetical protein
MDNYSLLKIVLFLIHQMEPPLEVFYLVLHPVLVPKGSVRRRKLLLNQFLVAGMFFPMDSARRVI